MKMKKLLFISALLLSPFGWSQSIYEDFDSYKAGEYLGTESNGLWTTWTNQPASSEDTYVSNEESFSGNNSIKLEGGGVVDVVLPLGNHSSGHWTVSFMMLLPEGNGGYFNLLHAFDNANSNWAVQVYFSETGAGYLTVGGEALAINFSHPTGSWFEVVANIDIDNDEAELYVDNNLAHSWVWSVGSMNQVPTLDNGLDAINFYPAAPVGENALYFIDDVSFSNFSLSISETTETIILFPNPTKTSFYVNNVKNNTIQVFNVLGENVFENFCLEESVAIDCDLWDTGIYLIKVFEKDGFYKTSKLIIKK